jgi:hypothetical protein
LNRRLLTRSGLALAGLGVILAAGWVGCDYSPPDTEVSIKGRTVQAPISPSGALGSKTADSPVLSPRSPEERKAILDSSITLIERAAMQPGGEHYAQAVKKLNQYFEGTNPAEYQLDSSAREYLTAQFGGPQPITEFQREAWTDRDTRHVEDCMMYSAIAKRVSGVGDDLTRVRRLFDWMIRQIELVPAGSFGASRLGPAFARPYDVLLRGMATESPGTAWAERAWIFMALCRQLDIDVGLITYTRGNTLEPLLSDKAPAASGRAPKPQVVWICAALIGEQAYLFDTRLGLEVPGPDGEGVATLEQALADSSILERMNLPGLIPYPTTRATLLASPSKIGILIDSSPGYFAPKMKLLQRELPGKYRTILFSDPAQQRDHFVRALGARAGAINLWEVPLRVQARLFTDAEYVTAIQNSLYWFRPEYPLVYARVRQLRGEFKDAIEAYVSFRLAVNAPLVTAKKKAALPKGAPTTIPKEVQDGLNVYATYYLALSQLENENLSPDERLREAEAMFRQVLAMVPEPPPGQQHPYYYMFRWGANTNLARIQEARKDDQAAISYYTQFDPTSQGTGNLLRARELVWRDPLSRPTSP